MSETKRSSRVILLSIFGIAVGMYAFSALQSPMVCVESYLLNI